MDNIPGWEGSLGPFTNQYTIPHVYARDIHSGAGNCVCGTALPDELHVQAAPGIEVPGRGLADDLVRFLGKAEACEEDQFLLTIAYQAGPDPRIAFGADGHRDYFSARELERACWSLLRSGAPTVGLFHSDGSEGAAEIVESSIHRADPWVIEAVDGSAVTVGTGDWLVGMICDDTAWDLYKRGLVAGVSPQGAAKRRRPTPSGIRRSTP